MIASDDSGSVSMVDVANGTTDRPAAVGRRRALPPRWISVRTDGCWPRRRSKGRSSCGTRRPACRTAPPLTADTSPVNDVAFSPDGRTLVSSHLRSAVVWNMNGEQAIGEPLGGPTDLTTDVSFSPDGKWLAAGRFDGSAIVYDTETRRQARSDRRRLGRHRRRLPPRREPHRRRNDRREGAVLRPEERGGRRLPARRGRTRRSGRSAFSPDGRLLAVAVDPNGVERVLRPAAAGRGAALGRRLPESRGAGDRAGRRIGALRGLQPGRHAAGDRQLRRAARPVGCGHPGPPRQADDGWRTTAS